MSGPEDKAATRQHYELQACQAFILKVSQAIGTVPFTMQCQAIEILMAQGVIEQTADETEGDETEVPA